MPVLPSITAQLVIRRLGVFSAHSTGELQPLMPSLVGAPDRNRLSHVAPSSQLDGKLQFTLLTFDFMQRTINRCVVVGAQH